jgi:hypothetical protein
MKHRVKADAPRSPGEILEGRALAVNEYLATENERVREQVRRDAEEFDELRLKLSGSAITNDKRRSPGSMRRYSARRKRRHVQLNSTDFAASATTNGERRTPGSMNWNGARKKPRHV